MFIYKQLRFDKTFLYLAINILHVLIEVLLTKSGEDSIGKLAGELALFELEAPTC